MTNGIDPRIGVWVNGAVFALGLLAAGSLVFPGVPDGVTLIVKGYAADAVVLVTGLNAIFHWYSAPTSGPGVK